MRPQRHSATVPPGVPGTVHIPGPDRNRRVAARREPDGEVWLRTDDGKWVTALSPLTVESFVPDPSVTLWRCTDCGKWSTAVRRPKHHQRWVGEDDGDWLNCGPFEEWVATRLEVLT